MRKANKAKVSYIDPVVRIGHRPAAEAVDELRECLSDVELALEFLARAFPGCIALGCTVGNYTFTSLVLAPGRKGVHASAAALAQMRRLARVVGKLPAELRDAFEERLARAKSVTRP